MQNAGDIQNLDRRKRAALALLRLSILALAACLALRFVPRFNDVLSGKPKYIRVLTESLARQVAAGSQEQFPVIVEENESGSWPAAKESTVSADDYQGTVYVVEYSEKRQVTFIAIYAVPADESKVSNLHTITPDQGKSYGPALLHPVRAVLIKSIIHVYPLAYLKTLHWRYKAHFPLSPAEGASMVGRTFDSGAQTAHESANIEFNYDEIRAAVASRHTLVNFYLSLGLAGCLTLLLGSLGALVWLYRQALQYSRIYDLELTVATFLRENLAVKSAAAERQFFAMRQQMQEQLREQEKLRLLRVGWEASLRSVLPTLSDEQLRIRVQEFLEASAPDVEGMEALWVEIQEQAGQKAPVERLSLLLESLKPYCTEEEFQRCQTEAFAVLAKSGFRPARKFAIAMHDEFKARAREMEEAERNREQEAS